MALTVTKTAQEVLESYDGAVASFIQEVENATLPQWVEDISFYNGDSDQGTELYSFFEVTKEFREKGASLSKGDAVTGKAGVIELRNKEYEYDIAIPLTALRRDKKGLIRQAVSGGVTASVNHWTGLVTGLLKNGTSLLSPLDEQAFFSNTHIAGKYTGQTNIASVDISALPTSIHGSVTMPTPEELAYAVSSGIEALRALKDRNGTYINEYATRFHALMPGTYTMAANKAFGNDSVTELLARMLAKDANNTAIRLQNGGQATVGFDCIYSLGFTDKVIVFRVDTPAKTVIRQQELEEVQELGPDSEYAVLNGSALIKHIANRGVGFANWASAALVTLV